jgi:mRNA interferase MazF
MIEAGDVVTALLPGVSETKRRPAVVISTSAYHEARPDALLALITSRIEKADTAFDATIYDWEESGLKLPSAMRSFLFTKPARELIKIGHLSEADWNEVQTRLKLAIAV